ncbi:multicopper oxidase domain-containing protein [Acidovorax sp. Be4]|uniref:Multicopper oxidase CueO n=1 Tax=Acidovorax bellezanensis TaxID=2976702 RepID=A0ABT2PSH7_9BURK|nr:multicopper oxidase domain-containing protein [Acidovorax sp. Be4]MCT9812749.1 multicopper oxidase domain-containing protein [Acidovorax sp. Be4]
MASSLAGTRRSWLKASLAATAAPIVLTPGKASAQPTPLPPSPPTTPWVEELPTQVTPLSPLAALNPAPTVTANLAGGECGRAPHQRFAALTVPGLAGTPLLYQLTAKENPAWLFNGNNPYYPPQPIWGYEGHTPGVTTPGPTIHARYGQSIICRIRNGLPQNHIGFGSPEISTHLHNMHMPSESDGFAGDFYSATQRGLTLAAPGTFNDHFYPNLYAGFDEFGGRGDPREALGSLFYHDHTDGVTAPNVLKGLFGRYMIFDDLDTGDETTGLRLPSGAYDYPLSFADKRFDSGGRLTFDELNPEGVLGDKIIVNGKIEPVLRVAARKYRLRLLNAGPSRFYEFALQNTGATTVYPYTQIASDGNLLPAPIQNVLRLRIAPAERADIIVDFSRFPMNTTLYLVNQLTQVDTRKPGVLQAPGTRVLKFIVDRPAPAPDLSQVPSVLRPLRDLPNAAALAALPVRTWVFARNSGMWTVNGQFFDSLTPRASINRGGMEIWEFVNPDNGWQHPIHVHFEEGRILSKSVNGVNVPIPMNERGRKDVFVVGELMTVRVLLRFRDFQGKYMMHCHNLTHEDHAMMVRFDIV